MKQRLLNWLRCPACAAELELTPFTTDGEEIIDGLLLCGGCTRTFPVHRGVPRMVVSPAYSDAQFDSAYGEQVQRVRSAVAAEGGTAVKELVEVKTATAASFGYEWTQYDRYGWDARYPHETAERRQEIEGGVFEKKALYDAGEYEGKLTIDCGCGNGRYVNAAMKRGAEVIGVDLSVAVDSAYRNIGTHPKVHIVQGDLFQLPFAPATFDQAFSIGVLMHTGDARRSFEHIVTKLKPGGTIAIHLYGKGNVVYEFLDDRIRRYTTKMDHEKLMTWCKRLEVIPKAVHRINIFNRLPYLLMNCVIRLEPGHHFMFDWWSAPAASHHTYDEVHGWMRANGLRVVRDHKRQKDLIRRILKSPAAGVTVKGTLTGV